MVLNGFMLNDKTKALKIIFTIIYLFRSSYEYAFMAKKSNKANANEESVLACLRSAIKISFTIRMLLETELDLQKQLKDFSFNEKEKLLEHKVALLKEIVLSGEKLLVSIKENDLKALTDAEAAKYQRAWKSVEHIFENNDFSSFSRSTEPLIPFS